MLLVELPTYMKHILRFNIGQNALLSAVPYLSLWIFSIFWSKLMDLSRSKGWITTTTVRKLSTGIGIFLLFLSFIFIFLKKTVSLDYCYEQLPYFQLPVSWVSALRDVIAT
jgi:ACS family sodium-dependent inorganic phosphate cotransporter